MIRALSNFCFENPNFCHYNVAVRRALRAQSFPAGFERAPLVFQFSSLSSTNDKWLGKAVQVEHIMLTLG